MTECDVGEEPKTGLHFPDFQLGTRASVSLWVPFLSFWWPSLPASSLLAPSLSLLDPPLLTVPARSPAECLPFHSPLPPWLISLTCRVLDHPRKMQGTLLLTLGDRMQNHYKCGRVKEMDRTLSFKVHPLGHVNNTLQDRRVPCGRPGNLHR